MKHFWRFMSYAAAILLTASLTFTLTAAHYISQRSGASKLTAIETLIEARFIGEYDKSVMEDAAAEAMVDALGDRWSHYIPASEMDSYNSQMSNSYVGIGVTISVQEDGSILITQVVRGGPAESAGILAGDRMAAVDGTIIDGMTTTQVSALVRGEAGTDVQITVERDGKMQDITITRALFETEVATCRMLDGEIGLIRIANFDSRCAQETIACIKQMMNEGAKGLVFDVRFNPGGYQHELVKVLDYILPEGVLFRSESYTGAVTEDRSDAACIDIPMVVLMNGDSYSAAEFFGAALSEYGVARIVGEKTCGKGYYQTAIPLADGSALNLSVGKYYTPNGVSLAGVGITPDVEIVLDPETAAKVYAGSLDPAEDPHIIAAMDILKK